MEELFGRAVRGNRILRREELHRVRAIWIADLFGFVSLHSVAERHSCGKITLVAARDAVRVREELPVDITVGMLS